MKLFMMIVVAIVTMTLFKAESAMALSTDRDSAYANMDGSSKFADPDDQLDGSQLGSVQFGNSSSNGNGSGFTFGIYGTNNPQSFGHPAFMMQNTQP